MPAKPVKPRPATSEKVAAPVDQSVLLGLLGYNCLQAYLRLIPLTKKQLSKFSLRPVEFTVLSLIKANPGINQKRLGQTINISPPNLATLLDRMQADGLLTRQRNPLDRRSQILVPTQQAARICEKAEIASTKAEALLNLDPAERAELIRLLQKIFLPE